MWGIPTGFLYQPIDQIRDYFGDGTAMYFSWLETYTKALIYAGAFGMITQINQMAPFFGDNPDRGVDSNALTLYYSVLLSVWSVVFLSVWKRREAEHAFLWGSEGLVESEEPRKQFKGEMKVNPETKREELVVGWDRKAKLQRLGFKALSVVVILLCMCTTVGFSFAMMSLKFRGPKECSIVLEKGPGPDTLNCHDWVQSVGDLGLVGNNTNVTEILKTRAQFDEGCCYDVTGESVQSNTETAILEGMGLWDKQKWPVSSAIGNLCVIIFMGTAYESVATELNDKENFRTESEYQNGVIFKVVQKRLS